MFQEVVNSYVVIKPKLDKLLNFGVVYLFPSHVFGLASSLTRLFLYMIT